jgi:protein arginine N-methyltransferase 2
LFYDVYTRLSDFHLEEIGIEVDWKDIDLTRGDEDRWGYTRKYFAMPFYRLPVGKMKTI